jgi:diaminopimelate decarboxylase
VRLVWGESGERSDLGESILEIPGEALERIAASVGTPAYVYHADAVRQRYAELTEALSSFTHRIHYSVKANSNLAMLRLLRELGAGADIVSGGELVRARRAGFAPNDIVFSGVGKTRQELEAAVNEGIALINVESSDELTLLADVARELGVVANLGIRVNPDVTTKTHPYTQTGERGMKFGVPLDEVLELARFAEGEGCLSLASIGMHIGSQIQDPRHFLEGAQKLASLLDELRSRGTHNIKSVDVGGGIGIQYTTEQPMEVEEFAAAIRPVADITGLEIMLEPGRFLVGNAGYVLTRCVHSKRSGSRNFVVVDAGMNDLLRPSLYGAVHDIRVVNDESSPGSTKKTYDVVGPICETGDFLGFERVLPEVSRGTLLVVCGAGAYGFTMSSSYNSRPRPPEVLVDGNRWAVIRDRETVEDLMRGEPTSENDELDWTRWMVLEANG